MEQLEQECVRPGSRVHIVATQQVESSVGHVYVSCEFMSNTKRARPMINRRVNFSS